jgi:hypothetical protein
MVINSISEGREVFADHRHSGHEHHGGWKEIG